MARAKAATKSIRLESSGEMLLGQDIPPRGPWKGTSREQGEESPEREQIGQPTHICPQTGRVSVCPAPRPARMGGGAGQGGGCTHSRFHPSADQAVTVNPASRLQKSGMANALSLLHTRHPSTVPLNRFHKSRGFNTVPSPAPRDADSESPQYKAKQYSMLKLQVVYLALY